jgi:hypothetical protein
VVVTKNQRVIPAADSSLSIYLCTFERSFGVQALACRFQNRRTPT